MSNILAPDEVILAPWHVEENGCGTFIVDRNGDSVAELDPEIDERANLMAIAPELFDIAVAAYFGHRDQCGYFYGAQCFVNPTLHAALDKVGVLKDLVRH